MSLETQTIKPFRGMNQEQLNKVINYLYEYAAINHTMVRTTIDLSPLEQWLLVKLSSMDTPTIDWKRIYLNQDNDL